MKTHSIARFLFVPLVGILLILAASGCGLTDISAKLDLVKVTQVSLERATAEVHVTVTNPSAIGISLDSVAVNLSVADSPLLAVVKEGPIDIAAHSSSHFVIPITVRFDRLYSLYGKVKDKDGVDVAADGVVRLKTAIGDPNIYFNFSGTMPLLKPPDLTLASWRVRELDVKQLRLDLGLKIENVSGKEIVMRNVAYTVGFKKLNLVNGKKDKVALLRPGQVQLIKIPAEVDIAAIRQSGLDEIVLEKMAQIKMRDLAAIGVVFGDEPTGLSRFARYAIDTLSTANNAQDFEERLPTLRPPLAAAEGAELLGLTSRSVEPSEPPPVAPVRLTASFLQGKWMSITLLLLCLPAGAVLMWVKTRWKTGAKILLTVALVMILGLMFITIIAAGTRSHTQQPSGAAPGSVKTPAAATPPEPQISRPDFVRDRLEVCGQYNQAANDIKRSEIYTSYFNRTALKPSQVNDMPGVLKKMATSRGGGIVLLTVETEIGLFGNNDMMQGGFLESPREIRRGSRLYHSIGELTEGQRVTFSGRLIVAEKETTEKMSVCGDAWLIEFTDIRAAQ